MSDAIVFWLLSGVGATLFCDWTVRLEFCRKQVTLATVACWLIGVLLPPLALFGGCIFLACWAIEPDNQYRRVQWPAWWGQLRLRQHRICRWLKYLGHPPAEENSWSGWRRVDTSKWQ